MGICASSRHEDFTTSVGQFEKSLPFHKVSLTEFEERVKRLIFEDDKNEITINQLIESFKDCPAFANELSYEGSDLRQVLLSKYLQKSGNPLPEIEIDLSNPNGKEAHLNEQNRQKIWVTGLLLLGILYCPASDYTRAISFFEIVQEGLND